MRAGRSRIGPLRRTIRRQDDLVRVLRYQKTKAVFRLTQGSSQRVRRCLFGPLELVTRRADRGAASRLGAPVRTIALYGLGRREQAGAHAEAVGIAARGPTALRLAGIALAAGDTEAAGRILAVTTDDDASLALRGEHAYLTGRFAQAAELLRRAVARRTDDTNLARILARAEAETALLEPDWRPDIGGPTPLRDRRPGRILHLLTNSLPHREAGYTVRAQNVARCQLAVGLDPQMVTRAGFPRNEGIIGAPRCEIVDDVTYHRLLPDLDPTIRGADLAPRTARAAVDLIEELRPALIQPTTNYANARVALALGEKFGLPVVYEVRGFLEETWLSKVGTASSDADRYQAARAAETDCMRRVDAIVTLSESMRTDILERGGIDSELVTVIPNAVDIERFRPGPRDEALGASLGIAPDEPVVGYISSFNGYEGIRYLIEAVALLRGRGRQVRLLLVGDGEELPQLRAVAQATGLLDDGTAIFTGRVPHVDILRYYRMIDVFVVPRTNDRVSRLVTPLKPYEAMAMEKALVVSAVAALSEIVVDGETGRSFVPEDAASLADVLEPLLDDPAERARLGAAARAWVAANRTWDQNGARYRALYDRMGVT